MTVFVTSKSFGKTAPEAVKMLEENGFIIRRFIGSEVNAANIAAQIDDADVLVVGNDPVDETVLQAAKNLKLVHMHGTGLDAIDVCAASRRGILVANAPGANRNAVAEMTVALMLTAGRRIDVHQDLLRQGRWERTAGHELSNATIGIIGLGNIGRRVVELLAGFDVHITAFDPFADAAWARENQIVLEPDADRVFAAADYLVLTAPLVSATEKIVNDRTLALMKKNAYIINTARGGLIDEDALCRAVREKKIAGAALDTFVQEPPPPDSPLRSLDLVLTPHIAATSIETAAKVSRLVAEHIIAILKQGRVDLAVNAADIKKAAS